MRKTISLVAFLALLFNISLFAQGGVNVEGYVFEQGNRGYLNLAKVTILDAETGEEKGLASTDKDGVFLSILPAGKIYDVIVEKDLFTTMTKQLSTVDKQDGDKVFLKFEMNRKPGYIFDVTIAEKRANDSIVVDAISGSTIEVYNNTKKESTLTLVDHPSQIFKCHFEDGNHYTVLIRKKNYYNKRMEAFVNVKGCILCFEGVGEVKPSDVLTEGNTMGTLVANVELQPIKMNEGVLLENLYYEYSSAKLTDQAKYELDKLINILKNNPALIVELGSHTDSRGDDKFNYDLSSRRAQSAVDYIITNSGIDRNRVRSYGYGETQLVNKCKNGIRCSEDDHKKNRRTELKVVGLLDIDPFKNKTLTEIIEEENFEKMLAELQNEEQVVIQSGEELPDELKRSLAGNDEEAEEQSDSEKVEAVVEEVMDTEATINSDIIETTEEVVRETEVVEEVVEEVIETTNNQTEVKEVVTEVIEEIEVSNPVINTTTEDRASGEVVEEVEILTETIVEEKETIVEKVIETIPADVSTEVGGGKKIFVESVVQTPVSARRPIDLPELYTGYRIEFINSPYQLPGSHAIFQRHGKITMDQIKNGTYSYMIGSFREEKDAADFLKNIMIGQYPSAKLVRYKKGNRIDG